MSERKPKAAGFCGQFEVLGYIAEGEVETHHGIAAFLGVPTQAVAIVLRRQVRLGRVVCLRRSGRGRYPKPGLFQITEQGRQYFESGKQASGKART